MWESVREVGDSIRIQFGPSIIRRTEAEPPPKKRAKNPPTVPHGVGEGPSTLETSFANALQAFRSLTLEAAALGGIGHSCIGLAELPRSSADEGDGHEKNRIG